MIHPATKQGLSWLLAAMLILSPFTSAAACLDMPLQQVATEAAQTDCHSAADPSDIADAQTCCEGACSCGAIPCASLLRVPNLTLLIPAAEIHTSEPPAKLTASYTPILRPPIQLNA